MIKCKEDLKNTYIVNDHGELRDLYISALGRFGVDTCESDEHFLIYEPDDYPHMDTAMAGWHNYNNSRRLTLSDLKPRTRTEYEKVTESIFDLRDEFERGELHMKGRGAGGDFFNKITTEYELVTFASRGLYRKFEKEIDWTADVMDFLGNELQRGERVKHADVELFCDGSKFINMNVSLPKDRFLELCRVALRANGELD